VKRAFVFLAIFAPVATLCLLSSCDNKSTNSDGGSNAALDTNTYGISWNSAISYGILTDSRDGQCYRTVKIGTQTWMVENLKSTRYRNGDTIPNVTDAAIWTNLTTGGYCNYNNEPNLATTYGYGRLDNWYSVSDSRNLATVGWHVSTDGHWTIL